MAKRINAQLTEREARLINQLRRIKNDDVYDAVSDMVQSFAELARDAAESLADEIVANDSEPNATEVDKPGDAAV